MLNNRDRMVHFMNVLRLVQDEIDLMNDRDYNIQAYLSPVANEIIMSAIVQPYYNNILNIFINNNIHFTEKCLQTELLNGVVVRYLIQFNVEPLANYLL